MKKFVLLILLVFGIIAFVTRTPSVENLAARVLTACEKEMYRTSCYEKEIPKLMDRISMEKAFAVTKIVQDADPQFAYCHVLAHEISFRESAKNPNGWKEVLNRCPVAACNYGCLHGSLVQHFRGQDVLTDEQIEQVLPDLRSVCEPREGFAPSPVDRSMCYHAIGHLAMYISGGDPARSLVMCSDVVPDPDTQEFMQTCAGGVFMTVFQGIDPEDIALVAAIKPQKENVPAFCAKYQEFWRECRQEAVALFWEEVASPDGYVAFCSWAQTQKEIESCTFVAMNDVTVRLMDRSDGIAKLEQYCLGVSQDRRELCFAAVAMRLVQIDPVRYLGEAQDVCKRASAHGVGQRCFEGIVFYASFTYPVGSEDWQTYCESLEDPWKTSCVQKKEVL